MLESSGRRLAPTRALLLATAASLLCLVPAGAAWATCTPGKEVHFHMLGANAMAVSAEVGEGYPQYGLLRARTTPWKKNIRAWEHFRFTCVMTVPGGDDVVTIRSLANNTWVTTRLDFPETDPRWGMLTATTTGDPGERELFIVTWQKSLLKPPTRIRSWANRRYVSTELGYGKKNPLRGMLRARATTLGEWENVWVGYWPA